MRVPTSETRTLIGACFVILWLEELGRVPAGTSPIIAREAHDWKAICDEHGYVADDEKMPFFVATIFSEKIPGLEDPEAALKFAHEEVHYLSTLL